METVANIGKHSSTAIRPDSWQWILLQTYQVV